MGVMNPLAMSPMIACCLSWATCRRLEKQSLQTRCACDDACDSTILCGEHAEQMHQPQLRQWCLRRENPNARLQAMQCRASASGIHPGRSPLPSPSPLDCELERDSP